MENTILQIKEILSEPMQDLDIIVDSVEYVTENRYHFLKIVLDRVNGLDLDTIVEATNIINPLLDKYSLLKEKYILDVSSKERG